MKNLLNFQAFNESYSSKAPEPIIAKTPEDFIKKVKKINKYFTPKGTWGYNEFSSKQADSQLPSAWVDNGDTEEHAMLIVHDDYDGTKWGVILLNPNGETGDEGIVEIHNLDLIPAWELFAKVVGDENAIYKDGLPFKEWLKKNPVYTSKKLKTVRDNLGVLEEGMDMNDDVVRMMRAERDRGIASGDPKWRKKLTPEQRAIEKEEQRLQNKKDSEDYRKRKKLYRLKLKLRELEHDRQLVYSDMENDPDVEPEGGMVADEYGKRIEVFDKQIAKIYTEIEKIEEPILYSQALKNTRDIGVFDKDRETE